MSLDERKQHFLACLSDPSRFSLIATLARGPLCVTELAGAVGLSQSCTTRHLQALLREGIVSSQRQGKKVVFEVRLEGPDAHPVLTWAFGAGAAALAASSTTRPRRRSRAEETPRVPRVREDAEVTDAMIVAHDSAWMGSDLGRGPADEPLHVAGAEVNDDPPVRADTPEDEDSPPTRRPALRRASLDDFLL
jgi:DNA-binding transcriptional ArsR family regulator